MKPNWQKLASLAHEICTLWFQFFGAVFASKGYPFKNIFVGIFIESFIEKKLILEKMSLQFAMLVISLAFQNL